MKRLNKWILKDEKGCVIIEGRKKEVENAYYTRWAYEHIYTDRIYRTEEKIS